MINFGVRVGLDGTELRKRLADTSDPAFLRVQKDIELAHAYKVNETPGFIVIAKGERNANVGGAAVFDILDAQPYKGLMKGP